jgi:hypothetical protein
VYERRETEMRMFKRDFDRLVELLAWHRGQWSDENKVQFDDFIDDLADLCEKSNPLFNRKRFMEGLK